MKKILTLLIVSLLFVSIAVLPSNAAEPEEETSQLFIEWSAKVDETLEDSGEYYFPSRGGGWDETKGWWSWHEKGMFFWAFHGSAVLEAHWHTLEGEKSISYWTISDFETYWAYMIAGELTYKNIRPGTGETVTATAQQICEISNNGIETIREAALQPFVIDRSFDVPFLYEFFLEGLYVESVCSLTGKNLWGEVIDKQSTKWFPLQGAPRTVPFYVTTQTFFTESDQPFVVDLDGQVLPVDLTVHWKVEVSPLLGYPPQIYDIIVTGSPYAKNPMTECPTSVIVNTVKFEAEIFSPSPDFEVTKVSWTGDMHKPGEGNPYETWYDPGTHGKKTVVCTITYRNLITNEIGTDTVKKMFDLFFVKDGDDDGDGVDNWYDYWSSSRDAACSFDASATYRYGGGSYAGNNFARYNSDPNNPVYTIFNHATMAEKYNAAGLVVDRRGIDCVEASLKHEKEHQRTDAKWQPGGAWHTLSDADGDELPDEWEVLHSGLGFDPNNPNSFPGFPYGDDEEVWCEMVAQGTTGVAANDWANPGKQSDPEYKRIVTENGTVAMLSGTCVDYGRDTDGDGLYNYLTIEVGVNVVTAGTYSIFGNLYDQKERMLWAENYTYLDVGIQSVTLNFDGLEIHKRREDGPYQLRYLTLFGKNFTDEMPTPYSTSPYGYAEFDGPVMEFTGIFSDYGTDTDGDGSYNYLTIETEVNVEKSGTYTTIGYLYDGNGNSITSTMESAYLDVGRQLVVLNFDGLSINRHRADGPYNLRYLSVSGSDQVDFIYDAYKTSAYSYTDFQKTDAGFTVSYSDHGKDTDGDGRYNYLTVEVGIDVSTSGNYALVGWLYDNTEAEMVMATFNAYLDVGSQIMPLDFDGVSIYDHGVDGPYDLKYLTLYDENGALMDTLNYAYTTATYNYAQFQQGVIMDNIRPETTLDIGEPKNVDLLDNIYVSSATPFTLNAEDNPGGTGVASTTYRIYNGVYDTGWLTYAESFYLTGITDGLYSIDYYSTDVAGNVEPTNTINVTLDNIGPEIAVSNPPAGWALQDGVTFSGSITDVGSGVSSMNFSIREQDGGTGTQIGHEDLPVSYDLATGQWSFSFDTLLVPDGYYVLCIEAEDNLGNEASTTVPYSIRNWAVIELLPSSQNNKAGRTMPVKFALRVSAEVDPNQPFVYNEELRIEIYATSNSGNILQESYFGETSRDYRISSVHYITNFKTLKTPMEYTVAIYRDTFDVGSFTFKTVK